jgi:hypothetical protein
VALSNAERVLAWTQTGSVAGDNEYAFSRSSRQSADDAAPTIASKA